MTAELAVHRPAWAAHMCVSAVGHSDLGPVWNKLVWQQVSCLSWAPAADTGFAQACEPPLWQPDDSPAVSTLR